MIKLEKLRIKVGRISFSQRSGKTYISLIDMTTEGKVKVVGRIILEREYSDKLSDVKEVVFIDK